MRLALALLAGLAGAGSLAGCAAPPQAGGATAEAAASRPAEPVDGRYRGIARLVRAEGRGCPRSGNRMVTVEGNALTLPYRGERASYALLATVSPDGSVHGSDGRGTIEGQINGSHMDLIVQSQYCMMRYALDRI